MASLNKVFLIGNLTKDPELRYTPNGIGVVNLRVAVNRKFRDRSTGDLKEETCFVTTTAWDKQAEACNQYLSKGSPVFVEGTLQSRSWEANDGQKRSTIEIRAERVRFLGPMRTGKSSSDEGADVGAETPVEDSSMKAENISWDEEENAV